MIVKTYIPQIHDIHLYNPEAVYTPPNQATCPCCCNGVPVAYNPQCQGAAVDWSGVSLRQRSFYRRGPTTASAYDQSNINYYNTGVPCAVLITPQHALISTHYRGTNPNPNPNESYTFLGKSGTKYTMMVSKVTVNTSTDRTLLEFSESVPVDDVKVYNKIADVQYIPTGHTIWYHDCNGKCLKSKMGVATWQTNPPLSYPFSFTQTVILGENGINEGAETLTCSQNCFYSVFSGDSGTPYFVLDKYNDTILIGLSWSGGYIRPPEMDNLNALISQVSKDYQISRTKISAKAADFNQDGNVDGADLAVMQANFGKTNSICDLNFNGVVDGADLAILLAEFGSYTIQPNSVPPL